MNLLLLQSRPGASRPRGGILRGHAFRRGWTFVILLCGLAAGTAVAQPIPPDANQAVDLYATHCRACHTDQVHWRDAKTARDWDSLVREVDRWQSQLGLNWTRYEVRAVARHLNRLYYRFLSDEGRVVGQLAR